MHPYSIDSNERKVVPFYLAAMAIAITWGFYSLLSTYDITLPWWIDAPSVLGFYEILFLIFDNYVWRLNILNKIGIIKTPMISGGWVGKIISSFDSTERSVAVEISQTWTRMEICLRADGSTSRSTGAFFVGSPPSGPVLTYQYQNDPAPGTSESMNIHYGTARLVLTRDKLEGDYYSGRGRQTNGEILLKKRLQSRKSK